NAKFVPEWVPRFMVFTSTKDAIRVGLAALEAEAFVVWPKVEARRIRQMLRNALKSARHAPAAPAAPAAPDAQVSPPQEAAQDCSGSPGLVDYAHGRSCTQSTWSACCREMPGHGRGQRNPRFVLRRREVVRAR